MNILIVMAKEILDNLRDRQTVFYALLFGPVLLPLIIGGSIVGSLKQFSINFDEVSSLAVVNAEAAPNFIAFLYGNNIDAQTAPDDVNAAVRRGDIPVALEIMPDFAKTMRAGEPAPLTIYVNNADKTSTKAARKVQALVEAY